jgi:hypothetical protein
MADGPVANLPPGMDAYAGYTDNGGDGITFPGVVARFPNALHLSISVHGAAPAECGDVESGALRSWQGYRYGYTSISRAQALINQFGRPVKLWVAHYDPALGAHICSPSCGFGFQDHADGTQWVDHGGWDESLLRDDFFAPVPVPPPPVHPVGPPPKGTHVYNPPIVMQPWVSSLDWPGGGVIGLAADGSVYAFGGAPFLGSAAGQAYFKGRKAAQIVYRATGVKPGRTNGYVIIDTANERYNY